MLHHLLLFVLLLAAPVALAADFRIETKVFSEGKETPLTQNTTLFQSGVVYDFLESPRRVAIFRHGREGEPGQFLLIDPNRNLKTEISTVRIEAAIDKLQTWAMTQENPLLRFAADPQFKETFDAESGLLTLTGSHMTYRLTTMPVGEQEVSADLRSYLDNYAKLNCLLGSSMPPLPRLMVNKAITQHRLVPVEVKLSLATPEKTTLRAEHFFTWALSKDDRARIALVGEQLVNFRNVSNAKFQKGMAGPKKK